MELIRTIRERNQTKREADIRKQAEDTITLSDFGSSICIAYLGLPLIHLSEDYTSKEILAELERLRENFINAKIKKLC